MMDALDDFAESRRRQYAATLGVPEAMLLGPEDQQQPTPPPEPKPRRRPDPKDLPGVAALTQTKADAKLQHRRDRGK